MFWVVIDKLLFLIESLFGVVVVRKGDVYFGGE